MYGAPPQQHAVIFLHCAFQTHPSQVSKNTFSGLWGAEVWVYGAPPLNPSNSHMGTPWAPLSALGYPLSTPGYPVLYLLSYRVVYSVSYLVSYLVPYLTAYLVSYLVVPMSYPALYCYHVGDFMTCHGTCHAIAHRNMSYHACMTPAAPETGCFWTKIWEYRLSYLVPGDGIFPNIDAVAISF